MTTAASDSNSSPAPAAGSPTPARLAVTTPATAASKAAPTYTLQRTQVVRTPLIAATWSSPPIAYTCRPHTVRLRASQTSTHTPAVSRVTT
jgi:hypothetical protein